MGNDFTFTRVFQGHCCTVKALPIPRLHAFSVTCKMNGIIMDSCQTDDPWVVGRAMMDDAFQNTITDVPAT